MTPRCLHITSNIWRRTKNQRSCGAMFNKRKAPQRLDSTSLRLERDISLPSDMYLYLSNVTSLRQLWKGSKKVDRTYIGSLVQTHLSWDATSQSQSSLRSKSELVLLLNRRSRSCMQRTMWTVLVSNTGWIDQIVSQDKGTRVCLINTARSVR